MVGTIDFIFASYLNLVKMLKKITLLLLGILYLNLLPAQNLHCLFFAANEDKQIGKGVQVSLQKLRQQIENPQIFQPPTLS